VSNSIDVVIVTNERFYEDILNQVYQYNKNIIVIDINTFCKFDIAY